MELIGELGAIPLAREGPTGPFFSPWRPAIPSPLLTQITFQNARVTSLKPQQGRALKSNLFTQICAKDFL